MTITNIETDIFKHFWALRGGGNLSNHMLSYFDLIWPSKLLSGATKKIIVLNER